VAFFLLSRVLSGREIPGDPSNAGACTLLRTIPFLKEFMKMLINLLIGAGLLSSSCALSKDAEAQISRSQINFYKVQLVCPAAPHIGCGSASKPVLLGLEGDPLV